MNKIDKTLSVNLQGTNHTDSAEAALEAAYKELGKTFYENRFEEPTPELIRYFDQITSLKAQISKRQVHMEQMNMDSSSVFRSLNDIPEFTGSVANDPADIQPEPAPSRPRAKHCPHCGKPLPAGAAFCGNCGKAVN